LDARCRLADELEVRRPRGEGAEAVAVDRVVVGDDDPDRPAVGRARIARADRPETARLGCSRLRHSRPRPAVPGATVGPTGGGVGEVGGIGGVAAWATAGCTRPRTGSSA